MSIAPVKRAKSRGHNEGLTADVQKPIIGLESGGVRMTPEEFDAIGEGDYDENYRYELIDGVLVVHAIPLPDETDPNELLGQLIRNYKDQHPQGSVVDATLPQQYVRLRKSRRIADRLIWIGLGRRPKLKTDVATIAIELVSAGKRNWRRDYESKRDEYRKTGIKEYWIIDRFRRTLTVYQFTARRLKETVIPEKSDYQTDLLPGFTLPLARILAAADCWADEDQG